MILSDSSLKKPDNLQLISETYLIIQQKNLRLCQKSNIAFIKTLKSKAVCLVEFSGMYVTKH